MCDGQGQPSSLTAALAMLDRALDFLNAADAPALPAAVQAEGLRALERAEAKQTAARAGLLAAFTAQNGYEDDGQGSARTWLRWQTRITSSAAAGAVGWARRLTAHPVIWDALVAGELSESWARQVCEWTDRLPDGQRGDADEILAAAARGGADLTDLAGLAREMYERSHRDDPDGDGFDDRYLRLGITFRGAGRTEGDLTPACAAAMSAVLEALGKKAGPEDTRTAGQRRHDALEEACRRLIASGMLPSRGGQPVQAYLHITLSQLRDAPGASQAEAAWAAARASQTGWLTGPDADAAACDATLAPVVTGTIDWAALDLMTDVYLAIRSLPPARTGGTSGASGPSGTDGATRPSGTDGTDPDSWVSWPDPAGGVATCGCTCGGCTCRPCEPLSPATLARLRRTLLHLAADVMSGPGGLASWLRQAQLAGTPAASPSFPLAIPLPLDTGEAEPTIPASLRRAVLTRHSHCTFPGCRVPATACQIHHYIPRARGGPTAIGNLGPVCAFHHLIVIHRWGWTLHLNADGTTTATSPDGRVLHSHGPPSRAA